MRLIRRHLKRRSRFIVVCFHCDHRMANYFRQFVIEPDFEAFSSRCLAAPRCACVEKAKRGLDHRGGSCPLPGGEVRFHVFVAVWTLEPSASSLLVMTRFIHIRSFHVWFSFLLQVCTVTTNVGMGLSGAKVRMYPSLPLWLVRLRFFWLSFPIHGGPRSLC